MKIHLPYQFLLLLLAGIVFCADIYAQESKIIVDSSYSLEPAPDEEEDEEKYFYPDTLKLEYRKVIADSVFAITTDKGFYYKRYLDSLLRASQIKLEKARAKFRQDSIRRENKTRKMKDGSDEESGSGTLTINSLFGFIIWVAAIGLFGYLVFKLFLSNSSLFLRNRKNLTANIETELAEDVNDLDAMLRLAIKNGNYRMAVRYLYLQTLKRLSDKKLIEINSNKTNYEYVNEMRKHHYANEFASLTLQYDYVWYGEYPVDERLFERLRKGFNQFNKNIGH